MHLSKHLYQSSSSGEKTGRYIARSTVYLLNIIMWPHASTSLKAAPGTNESYQEVKHKQWTVKTQINPLKEC